MTAKIDMLEIQGIRSFGPGEKQAMEFYTPLTLILGPNGTGKTVSFILTLNTMI
jgi:DNA repair protein RAD50